MDHAYQESAERDESEDVVRACMGTNNTTQARSKFNANDQQIQGKHSWDETSMPMVSNIYAYDHNI